MDCFFFWRSCLFKQCSTNHCNIQRLRVNRNLGQDMLWDAQRGIACQLGPLKQHECAQAMKLLCVAVPEWTGDKKSARQWRGSSFVNQVAPLWLWCIHEPFCPAFSFQLLLRKFRFFPSRACLWKDSKVQCSGPSLLPCLPFFPDPLKCTNPMDFLEEVGVASHLETA